MKSWLDICKIKNRNKLASQRGFTLLEVLVAATIFSIISLGLALSFMSGMKLWSRARSTHFSKYNLLLSLEIISKELRQSVDVPSIGYTGTTQEFSFPLLLNNSIVKISYKFDPNEKSLIRRQVNLKDMLSGQENEVYTEKKILTLEQFYLTYFYLDTEKQKYIWTDTWMKEKGIFTAIKLQGELNGEEFTKTIFIPIS